MIRKIGIMYRKLARTCCISFAIINSGANKVWSEDFVAAAILYPELNPPWHGVDPKITKFLTFRNLLETCMPCAFSSNRFGFESIVFIADTCRAPPKSSFRSQSLKHLMQWKLWTPHSVTLRRRTISLVACCENMMPTSISDMKWKICESPSNVKRCGFDSRNDFILF